MTAYLAELKLGTLELSPSFVKTTKSYTATATGNSNKITARAEDSKAQLEIKLGDTVKQNGDTLTWAVGENVVTVRVTSGAVSETYTVTVTKEE